jgi:hypothetical protein
MRHCREFALLVLFPVAAQAAGPASHDAIGSALTLRGNVRLRAEALDGQYRRRGADSDSMFSLRTTVLADYAAGPVHVGAEIWDARAYGQAPTSSAGTGEANALELTQAYIAVDLGSSLPAGSAALLTAGRFTLDLGSRRLVSRQVFRNSTNAYTGVKLAWAGSTGDRATLFWAMPHRRLPNGPAGVRDNRIVFDHEGTDTQLFGASLTRASVLGGSLELYGYGLTERDSPGFVTTDRRLFTPGLRLFAPPRKGRFDHDMEVMLQAGSAVASLVPADTHRRAVRAWALHAEIGHSFTATLAPRVAVQWDYASGDDADPDRLTRFDPLYAARRFEFGPSGLYGPVMRANLMSAAVRMEVTPTARLDGFIAWRPLWLARRTDEFGNSGIVDRTGRSGRFAGHQVETRLRYWLVPGRVRFDGGVAVLAKGRFLRDAPGARANGDTHYGYTDLSFDF